MKKIIALTLCAFLITGCSSQTSSADPGKNESTPEATPEPTAEPTPEPTAEPTPEPTAEPTPAPEGWRGFLDGERQYLKYTCENLDFFVPDTLPLTEAELDGFDKAFEGSVLYIFLSRIDKEKVKENGIETKEDAFRTGLPEVEYVKDGDRYWYLYDNEVDGKPIRYIYALMEDDAYFWDFHAALVRGNSEEDDTLLKKIVKSIVIREN